jgi:thymidylate synthase (FAD)
MKQGDAAYDIYHNVMRDLAFKYKLLQELGIPNEDARMILPNACETQIEVKMNLRTLMNFMNERLCTCAQWEIRELALAMKKAIVEKYPELEPYLVPKCEKYGKALGFCMETKKRREQLSRTFGVRLLAMTN